MDKFSSYDNALMFDHAFDILYDRYQNGFKIMDYKDVSLVMPLIVNLVFACELFLKSLLPEGVKGHKLYNDLFVNIDKSIQDKIRNLVIAVMKNTEKNEYKDYDSKKFNEEIIQHEECFVNQRYWHEGSNVGTAIHINFLLVLEKILKAVVEEKYGLRPKID